MIQVLDDFLPSNEIESIYYAHHNQMNFNLNIATINRKADDIFIDELTRDSFQFCSTHYDSKDRTSSRYLPDLLKILEYAKVKYESISYKDFLASKFFKKAKVNISIDIIIGP